LGEDENGEDVGSEKEWTSLIPWVIWWLSTGPVSIRRVEL